MPEENRFAGLSEAVEDDESDGADVDGTGADSTEAGSAETDSSGDTVAEADSSEDSTEVKFDAPSAGGDAVGDTTETESETAPDEDDCEPTADSIDDDPSAFPFDATEKKTVYVRPETVDGLEDARALVDAQLRTDHDVRDLTGREFYDAVFRLAAADTDGLIDEILEARDE